MKIYGTSTMKVISKSTTKSKDGQNTYYKLGVLIGSEAGMISCSEEIYNLVQENGTYNFGTVYDDSYKSFRIYNVIFDGSPEKSSPEKASK